MEILSSSFQEKRIKVSTKTFLFRFIVLLFLLSITSLYKTQAAEAASLYLSPSSGSYTVGQDIPVSVYVSTASGEVMNAASVTLNFPTDKLAITSVSKSGSIVNLWANDPSFSNQNGKALLEGVVLNPGFSGHAGKLLILHFKVLAVGQASVVISAGTVLANDGQGTNILNGVSNAAFTLNSAANIPPPKENETPVETASTTESTTTATSTIIATTTSASSTAEATVEPENLITNQLPPPWNWGIPFLSYLSFGVVVFSLIFLLLFIICAAILKFMALREKIQKDTKVADALTHKSFTILKQEVAEHALKLKNAKDKRELTQEEKEFLNQFNKDLDDAEKVVRNEINRVGKKRPKTKVI